MARIIIARPSGADQIEVDQSTFDRGFFPGYVYVRDASSSPSTEPNVLDAAMAGLVPPASGSATSVALRAASVALFAAELASNPDVLIAGTITRDANGAATSAPVVWPDGTPGTYTADTVSTAFPGAVDAYHITYGSPAIKTYTQPAVTRDSSTGAVTTRPALTVA